jgi:acetyl-CoA carboxylase beta subunit
LFPDKKCPACKSVIYHEKWNITPKVAEDRWAHKEAKQRELEEVVDFLAD